MAFWSSWAAAARPRAWLPETLGAIVALVAARWVAWAAWSKGFPLDDAWIHMVYGLAIRQTGSFEYNDGVAGAGATSPAWAIVASLAHAATGASGPSMAAAAGLKVAGALSHAAAAALAGRLARQAAPRASVEPPSALAAALVVGACPVLAYAAASGMEVSLASALLIGALVAGASRRLATASAIAGLAVCVRPECVVVAPLALALALRGGGVRTTSSRSAAAAIALFAAPSGVWVVRNLLTTGRPLPATLYAKAFGVGANDGAIESVRVAFFDMLAKSRPMNRGVVWVLVAIALATGARASLRWTAPAEADRRLDGARVAGAAALAGVLYVAGVALYTRFYEPGLFYFQRYLLPAVPILLVAAVSALAQIATFGAHTETRARGIALALLAAGVGSSCWEAAAWNRRRSRYEADVASIDAVQVTVGKFLAQNLAADAVVWSPDAGAARYFGRRRILDLAKLNTPEPLRTEDIPEAWAPDAIVLIVPYGYRARSGDRYLPTVLEAPEDWAASSIMPQQTVTLCPPGMPVEVRRGVRLVAQGWCRKR